jgi:hypothetical protein
VKVEKHEDWRAQVDKGQIKEIYTRRQRIAKEKNSKVRAFLYSSSYGSTLGYSWWGFGWEIGFKGKFIRLSRGVSLCFSLYFIQPYLVFTLGCFRLDWVCWCWWVQPNYGVGFNKIWFRPYGCAWTWAIWDLITFVSC